MIVLYTWVNLNDGDRDRPRRYHYLTDRTEREAVCGHLVQPWDIIATHPPNYGIYSVEFSLCDDCMRTQARADIRLVDRAVGGEHKWNQVYIGTPHRRIEVSLTEDGYAQFQAAMARLRNLFNDKA